MTSEQKFKVWYYGDPYGAPKLDSVAEMCYAAWNAGRESMREEAIQTVEDSGPYTTRLAFATKIKSLTI